MGEGSFMKRMVGSGQALRMRSALMVANDMGGSDTASHTSGFTASTRKSKTPPSWGALRQAVVMMTQNKTGPAL